MARPDGATASSLELVRATFAGVAMGVALDRWVLPPLVGALRRPTPPHGK